MIENSSASGAAAPDPAISYSLYGNKGCLEKQGKHYIDYITARDVYQRYQACINTFPKESFIKLMCCFWVKILYEALENESE